MARFFRRRRYCRFTVEGVKEIDYKDLNTLKAYISETGKIVPSRITGTKARYQRQLARAIKRGAFPRAASLHRPASLTRGTPRGRFPSIRHAEPPPRNRRIGAVAVDTAFQLRGGGAVIGLATLRYGMSEGALVLAGSALVFAAAMWGLAGSIAPAVLFVVVTGPAGARALCAAPGHVVPGLRPRGGDAGRGGLDRRAVSGCRRSRGMVDGVDQDVLRSPCRRGRRSAGVRGDRRIPRARADGVPDRGDGDLDPRRIPGSLEPCGPRQPGGLRPGVSCPAPRPPLRGGVWSGRPRRSVRNGPGKPGWATISWR